MSQLDAHFAATASRGLPVQQEPAMGESTLEPGFLYLVEGASVNTIYAIAAHKIADVAGKRFALKVIADAEEPPSGVLEIVPPAGQLVEDDDGVLTSFAIVGKTDRGNYREWVCDPDGNWLMVARKPLATGGVPLGQIVIRGVPVVIQGVPLVNTVPPLATRAALPPLVAKPATIVPRRAPLAAPRAGEVIELEDAFADASLEMDAAGEHFRVAEIRVPVTLRTTSIADTVFVEVGLVRFDATPYGADFVFVAEIEASSLGQSVELQLYDLTAASVVVTLASSSIVTEKQSAAVTLPLAEHLYSVRLRRVGGDSSERVSCRSAAFERS